MNLEFRRRAIYTGLKPYLNQAEMLQALKIWEQDYVEKPTYALSVFVARCCNTPTLKQKRLEMLRSVINALDLDESELLDDSVIKTVNPIVEKRNFKKTIEPGTLIFAELFQQLMSYIDREDDERKIRKNIIARVRVLNTAERRVLQMQDWIARDRLELETSFYVDFLRAVMNVVYMEMCDFVGAVKADVYLTQAIRNTLPVAQQLNFNAHDLL